MYIHTCTNHTHTTRDLLATNLQSVLYIRQHGSAVYIWWWWLFVNTISSGSCTTS